MKELVLVVEGEVDTRRSTRGSLEGAGYAVRDFPSAVVLEEMAASQPSLFLIAASLPGGSGLELSRRIRQNSSLAGARIVLLLDRDDEEQRMAAREAGADDCVAKPFSPGQLLSRIQSVLRPVEPPPFSFDEPTDIVIDRAAMKLSVHGIEVTTTTLEFRLVDYLAQHRGRVCTRDVLLDAVWGEMQFVTPRSVDACIRRLRDKIEPNRACPTYLKTVRGVGYCFNAHAVWPTLPGSCSCRACSPSIGPGFAHVAAPRSGKTVPA